MESLFLGLDLPYNDHLLDARLSVLGIEETRLGNDQVGYGVYRVPQFRLEPKNFVHPFDNVDYIVFVASVSGYDSYLIENKSLVSIIPSCTAMETFGNHCIIRIDYRGPYHFSGRCC